MSPVRGSITTMAEIWGEACTFNSVRAWLICSVLPEGTEQAQQVMGRVAALCRQDRLT